MLYHILKPTGKRIRKSSLQSQINKELKKNYSVIGTPTFLLLVEGKERDRMLGIADREMLTNLIPHS
jgi:hypothetical protein